MTHIFSIGLAVERLMESQVFAEKQLQLERSRAEHLAEINELHSQSFGEPALRPSLYDMAWEDISFKESIEILKDIVETEGYQT